MTRFRPLVRLVRLAVSNLAGVPSIVFGMFGLAFFLNTCHLPKGVLAEEGLTRIDPDGFLMGVWTAQPALVETVAHKVLSEAQRLSGQPWAMRDLLKKARMPRLAKALAQPL